MPKIVLSLSAFLLLFSISTAESARAAERTASFVPPAGGEPLGDANLAQSPPETTPIPLVTPDTATSNPTSATVELGEPVKTENLANVDPDTLGLLSPAEGGLGAAMWEHTPRTLVDTLLADLTLPTASPTLNGLARRLLLSTAAVPKGESVRRLQLTSLRLKKLLELGNVSEAWKLASMTKPGGLDADAIRLVTEAALMDPDNKDLCAGIPDIMAAHNETTEWQKALLLCQIRSGDDKAAQLSLDVMREQQVKDDVFILLANRALNGGGGQRLPRQLTPLRPLSLGLLRQMNTPLPPDLYSRPEAQLIPDLLATKSEDETLRLLLAEKSATRGTISGKQLAQTYTSVGFAAEKVADAMASEEAGVRLRALLYQAAEKETSNGKKCELIMKFVHSSDLSLLSGSVAQALAELASSIPVGGDSNVFASTGSLVYALAGKPDKALEWMNLAKGSASALPNVRSDWQAYWPLFVLSGIVTDADYAKEIKTWLDAALAETENDSAKRRTRAQYCGRIFLLFDAAGFAVPDEAWARIMDTANETKRVTMPSPVLVERLRHAGKSNRRGEAALLSLFVAGAGVKESLPLATTETVRALRLVGLTSDALGLAREAALAAQP